MVDLTSSAMLNAMCQFENQGTNGPINAHLISEPTVSTKTSFTIFDIDIKWVKVNSG